jgi:hypothetical protein
MTADRPPDREIVHSHDFNRCGPLVGAQQARRRRPWAPRLRWRTALLSKPAPASCRGRYLTPFKAEWDPKDPTERLFLCGRCAPAGLGPSSLPSGTARLQQAAALAAATAARARQSADPAASAPTLLPAFLRAQVHQRGLQRRGAAPHRPDGRLHRQPHALADGRQPDHHLAGQQAAPAARPHRQRQLQARRGPLLHGCRHGCCGRRCVVRAPARPQSGGVQVLITRGPARLPAQVPVPLGARARRGGAGGAQGVGSRLEQAGRGRHAAGGGVQLRVLRRRPRALQEEGQARARRRRRRRLKGACQGVVMRCD